MSAAVLREAAALMRSRAVGAQKTGVWRYDDTDKVDASDGAFTCHAASWSPAVALAVADWLEHTAAAHVKGYTAPLEAADALAVADVYLGTTNP